MSQSRRQPLNIVLLMSDQQRSDYVGYHAASRVPTPNIDRIAAGAAFDRCLSVNPFCTPARCALLTGKYTHQIGMIAMSGDLSRQHPTYARALQSAGYWTAGVGKFHWMQGWPWSAPRGQGHDLVALEPQVREYGWDHVWEVAGKQLAMKNFCHYGAYLQSHGLLEAFRDHAASRGRNFFTAEQVEHTGEPWPFDERHYVDTVTGDRVLQAIDQAPGDRPFFVFGSFCSPHAPFDPPARYLDAEPAHRDALDTMRESLRSLHDATPPAQLQWAAYGAEG